LTMTCDQSKEMLLLIDKIGKQKACKHFKDAYPSMKVWKDETLIFHARRVDRERILSEYKADKTKAN